MKNCLLYEGEFKNGEKHGLGKLYTSEKILIYTGEFLRDKMEGKGEFFGEKRKYYGSFVSDEFCGLGKLTNYEVGNSEVGYE